MGSLHAARLLGVESACTCLAYVFLCIMCLYCFRFGCKLLDMVHSESSMVCVSVATCLASVIGSD